jgi:hypothetical protein
MRWPIHSNRARFLDARCILALGLSPCYCCTGDLGSSFRMLQRPTAFIALQAIDSGALRAIAIRLKVQRWCRRSTACCSFCGSCVRRWLRRTLRRSAREVCPPKPYFAPLVGGAQADPLLCGKAFDGMALVEMTTNQPFPIERCHSGHELAMDRG